MEDEVKLKNIMILDLIVARAQAKQLYSWCARDLTSLARSHACSAPVLADNTTIPWSFYVPIEARGGCPWSGY